MFLAGLTSVALWDPEPLCSLKANEAVNRASPESASVFVCYTAQTRMSMSLTSCLHSWRGLEHKNTLGITHVLLWSAPQAPYGYSQHTGVGKTTTGHSLPPSSSEGPTDRIGENLLSHSLADILNKNSLHQHQGTIG